MVTGPLEIEGESQMTDDQSYREQIEALEEKLVAGTLTDQKYLGLLANDLLARYFSTKEMAIFESSSGSDSREMARCGHRIDKIWDLLGKLLFEEVAAKTLDYWHERQSHWDQWAEEMATQNALERQVEQRDGRTGGSEAGVIINVADFVDKIYDALEEQREDKQRETPEHSIPYMH